MVDFVAFLESAKNSDGVLDTRFADHHWLEAALEGGIFFDVFAVFIECGCTNGVELAAGELGFEQIGGIHRPLCGTSTDDGVEFVDEQNDLALAGSDFFEKGLETVLEFAAKLGASDHRADIHRDESFVFEGFRHIAADDAAGEALDDSGLADAWLANEHGVIFRTA